MIDNERVKRLSHEHLEQLKDICDEFDCWELECNQCPFELEEPYKREPYKREGSYITYRCSLAYAKQLYGRLHE